MHRILNTDSAVMIGFWVAHIFAPLIFAKVKKIPVHRFCSMAGLTSLISDKPVHGANWERRSVS